MWSLNHCLHQAYKVHLPSHGKHTSFHSPQLQTPSLCLTCAESGQHTKSLSDRLTFHTAPNQSLAVSDSPVLKVANIQSLEPLSDRLTFCTAPNPSLCLRLTCAESGEHANMSWVVQLHWQTYILHSSKPFSLSLRLSSSGQYANVSSCSVTDLHSPQLRTLFSLSDSPELKVAKVQVSWVTLWKTFSTAQNPSLSLCLRLTCAENGQHANVLSHSVTDLHSPQLKTFLSPSEIHLCWKRPTGKCLESLSDRRLAQLKVNLWTAAWYCPVHCAVNDIHLSKVFCNVLPSQSCCSHWIKKKKKKNTR